MDLQAGNSIMMGSVQLIGFIGPALAGILIGNYSNSDLSVGLAFALDAISFAASTTCLWLIRGGSRRQHSSVYQKVQLHLDCSCPLMREEIWAAT